VNLLRGSITRSDSLGRGSSCCEEETKNEEVRLVPAKNSLWGWMSGREGSAEGIAIAQIYRGRDTRREETNGEEV